MIEPWVLDLEERLDALMAYHTTLPGNHRPPSREKRAEPGDQTRAKTLSSEEVQRLILETLAEQGPQYAIRLAFLLEIHEDRVRKELKLLLAKGAVLYQGPQHNRKWERVPDVPVAGPDRL